MTAHDERLLNPRAVADIVRVVLNVPPCERSFKLMFKSNGDLRAVEIDGAYYAAVRRKRTTLHHEGDRHVTLVGVVVGCR